MSAPYIPATALGGSLLAPYLPVTMEWHADDDPSRWVSGVIITIEEARDGTRVIWYSIDLYTGFDNRSPVFLRLDPRRPEVAHRIADVLRARGFEVGHLLPVALGGRVDDIEEIRDDGRLSCGCPDGCDERAAFTHWDGAERCPKCKGPVGGYLVTRPEIPAADVSALTLAASVAGVEAGRGVVRGVCPAWSTNLRSRHWSEGRLNDDGTVIGGHTVGLLSNSRGWVGPDGMGGPETGPEGRACADDALNRLGFAYISPDAPSGVRVPFLSAEGR